MHLWKASFKHHYYLSIMIHIYRTLLSCTCQSFHIHTGPFNYDARFNRIMETLEFPDMALILASRGEGFWVRLGDDRLKRERFLCEKMMTSLRRVWYYKKAAFKN